MRSILTCTAIGSIFFSLFLSSSAQVAAVHLKVVVPEPAAEEKGVFIAGSFNYWHAGDSLFKMKKLGHSEYGITLPLFAGVKYEYKYNLGKWEKVETALNDSNIHNRTFFSSVDMQITDTVAKWKIPPPPAPVNPQTQKINAMKDSVLAKLQPELNNLTALLKPYLLNLLRENPDKKLNRELNKKAEQKLVYMYSEISKLFWNVAYLLSPEQKKNISKKLSDPSTTDFLNTFLNALNQEAGSK